MGDRERARVGVNFLTLDTFVSIDSTLKTNRLALSAIPRKLLTPLTTSMLTKSFWAIIVSLWTQRKPLWRRLLEAKCKRSRGIEEISTDDDDDFNIWPLVRHELSHIWCAIAFQFTITSIWTKKNYHVINNDHSLISVIFCCKVLYILDRARRFVYECAWFGNDYKSVWPRANYTSWK